MSVSWSKHNCNYLFVLRNWISGVGRAAHINGFLNGGLMRLNGSSQQQGGYLIWQSSLCRLQKLQTNRLWRCYHVSTGTWSLPWTDISWAVIQIYDYLTICSFIYSIKTAKSLVKYYEILKLMKIRYISYMYLMWSADKRLLFFSEFNWCMYN